MIMKKLLLHRGVKCLRGILLILLPLTCDMSSFGQNENCSLLDQKVNLHVSQGTFVYVISKLAQDYRIPIGLEKSSTHKDDPNINIDVDAESLKQVLTLLAVQEPEYKWELMDGVLNFTPTRYRDEFVSSLLNLHFDEIANPKGNDADSIRKIILNLPEVRGLMASKRVEHSKFMDDWSFQPMFSNKKIDLTTSNSKVRSFLNKVIKQSDHKTWVVEMVGRNRDKLLISF